MQSLSLVLLSVVALLASGNAQNLDPQTVQVSISELQEPPSPVYQLQFNFNVTLARALGSEYFMINESSLVVYALSTPPSAVYQLQIVILEQGVSIPVIMALTVVVTPAPESACVEQVFGRCSQDCVLDSSPQGYSCSCAQGYLLQRDQRTCLASSPLPVLLFATGDELVRFDLFTRLSKPLLVNGTPHHFDYHRGNQEVYYADNTVGKISRVSLTSGAESVLLSNLSQVTGLVVNWVDNSLLYSTMESIVELDLMTGTSTTLHSSLSQSRNLLFSTQQEQRMLYWVEGNSSFSIMAASLVDNQPSTVATNNSELLDLSIDRVSGDLYWITSEQLCRHGNGVVTCSPCCFGLAPTGLVVFEMYAYISITGSNRIMQHEIETTEVSAIYREIPSPGALSVLHPLAQPPVYSGVSDCGQCEQLCVVTAVSLSCDCQAGFRLGSDATSCFIDEVSDLVVAQTVSSHNNVVRLTRSGVEAERLVDISFGQLGDPTTGVIYAMDCDMANNELYFNDRNDSSLWRVSLARQHAGSDDRELLLTGVNAWDIAIDWTTGNLYWTDDIAGTIGMAPLSNPDAMVTIISGRNQPQGLEVDPINRYLYWVESGTNSIWRYSLVTLLPEVFLDELPMLSDLVLDLSSQTLYWSQLSGDIGSISLDGSNRQLLYSQAGDYPFKIALFKEFLIWIDGSRGFSVVDRGVGNERGTVPVTPLRVIPRILTSLVVPSSNSQLSLGEYMCINNVLGCSHYCQSDQNDSVFCTCPPGYTLDSDSATCLYSGDCPLCSGPCAVQGGVVSCVCPPGLRGRDCDQFCEPGMFGEGCLELCTCENGASCDPVDGSCNCTAGYEGSNCEQPVCEEACMNGGTCSAPNTCSCPPTFTGSTCTNRECTDDYCFNGGICIVVLDTELFCQCPSSTRGPRCEINDEIILPQTIAVAVGSPIGIAVGVIILAVLVGLGVFYYVKCIRQRKTNPQQDSPAKDIHLEAGRRDYGSASPTSETQTDLNAADSPYHIYVQT